MKPGRRPPTPPPYFRRLTEAAVAARGEVELVRQALEAAGGGLRRTLSRLRADGVAKTLALYDPRRLGRPCELSVRVKLRDYTRAAIAAFEARISADPAVTTAVFVSGAHDYELRVFLTDDEAISRWTRALQADPAVRWVRAFRVCTIVGDDLSGIRLGRV